MLWLDTNNRGSPLIMKKKKKVPRGLNFIKEVQLVEKSKIFIRYVCKMILEWNDKNLRSNYHISNSWDVVSVHKYIGYCKSIT